MSDQKFKIVELDSLKMEDGAKELMSAPEMQPYLRHAEAAMLGGNFAPPWRKLLKCLWRNGTSGGWPLR